MNEVLKLFLKTWLVRYLTRESSVRDVIKEQSLFYDRADIGTTIDKLPPMSKVIMSATGGGKPEFYIDGVKVETIKLADGRIFTGAALVSREKVLAKQNTDGTLTMVAKPVVFEVKQDGYSYSPSKRTLTPANATIPVTFKGTKLPVVPPPTPTGFVIRYGWAKDDPIESLKKGVLPTVKGNMEVRNTTDSYGLDFHLMPTQNYAFVEEDAALVTKNKVADSGAERNVAYPPDDVWREAFVVGTKRYYVTRIPTDYDTAESSRVFFSKL